MSSSYVDHIVNDLSIFLFFLEIILQCLPFRQCYYAIWKSMEFNWVISRSWKVL